MDARLWHLRRICDAAVVAGRSPAGQYQFRGRRLFRNSGDDRLPRRCGIARRAGRDRPVAGGAGAVGHYAVQFAKAAGATVITTISSPEKADAARRAGADYMIDYKRDRVGERIMAITGKRGVDAVIELDIAANASLIAQVLRPRGLVVVYGAGAAAAEVPLMFLLRNAITLQFIYVYELDAAERAAALTAIERTATAGTLITNVGKTFPLDEIVTTHEAVEQGKVLGNVVVMIR